MMNPCRRLRNGSNPTFDVNNFWPRCRFRREPFWPAAVVTPCPALCREKQVPLSHPRRRFLYSQWTSALQEVFWAIPYLRRPRDVDRQRWRFTALLSA